MSQLRRHRADLDDFEDLSEIVEAFMRLDRDLDPECQEARIRGVMLDEMADMAHGMLSPFSQF